MSRDQPPAVDLSEHDQNAAVDRDSGVGGLVDPDGVAEVPGAEDREGLDEVDVAAGGDAAPPKGLDRFASMSEDVRGKVVASEIRIPGYSKPVSPFRTPPAVLKVNGCIL